MKIELKLSANELEIIRTALEEHYPNDEWEGRIVERLIDMFEECLAKWYENYG